LRAKKAPIGCTWTPKFKGDRNHGGGIEDHAIEDGLQLTPRDAVLVTMKADRACLMCSTRSNTSDALLVTDSSAKDAAEQANVVTQTRVPVQ
jgi:hypothetical protein